MAGRAVLVWVAVAAGCSGDPSVSVRFEVPEAYRDLVDAVSLEVLATEDFDCDTVALGNAGAQEQAAARVAEAEVRGESDDAPLSGIPRTGSKLFVARALGAAGQLVAGGCASAGTIEGEQELAIEGHPALTLTARDAPSSGPLPDRFTVLVSDARGQPVEGIVAQQSVYAASEIVLPGPSATSGPGGVIELDVVAADWAGPQVIDVDVLWQANQRDHFAGFETPFARGSEELPAALEEDARLRAMVAVGRVGAGGAMGVAVLGRAGAGGRPVHVYTYDPDGDRFSLASSDPIPVRSIGLVEEEDRDVIVAMNPASWFTISPSGAVDMSGGSGLMDAAALAPIGDCQLGHLRRDVLAVSTSGQVAVFNGAGERIQDFANGGPTMVDELLAAGCVRGVESTYPAAIFSIVDGERPVLAIDAPRTQPAVVNSAIDRGFAFTPVLASGEGPFLLANRLETDGNSIARYTVVPVDGAPTFLDESGEDEIAGLSVASAGGDFDRDGRLDIASITAVALGDGRLELRFFMALGIAVEEERLFGLDDGPVPGAGPSPLLLTADFDQDGIDDLLVVTAAGFSLLELEPE